MRASPRVTRSTSRRRSPPPCATSSAATRSRRWRRRRGRRIRGRTDGGRRAAAGESARGGAVAATHAGRVRARDLRRVGRSHAQEADAGAVRPHAAQAAAAALRHRRRRAHGGDRRRLPRQHEAGGAEVRPRRVPPGCLGRARREHALRRDGLLRRGRREHARRAAWAARRGARARRQPRLLPGRAAAGLSGDRRRARQAAQRDRLDAADRREAVRARSRVGAAAHVAAARAFHRGGDLPDRPLPRQGDGAEHAGAAVRERHLRADLEPAVHRPRADHRRRVDRDRGAGRLLRGRGRDPRHLPESPATAARADRDGAADRLHRRVGAQREGEGASCVAHARAEVGRARPVRPRLHRGGGGAGVPRGEGCRRRLDDRDDRRRLAARPARLPELRRRHVGPAQRGRAPAARRPLLAAALSAPVDLESWTGEGVRLAEVETALGRLRAASTPEGAAPNMRTSVMTHLAWVPEEWLGQARAALAGMGERHPSRTILLVPDPDSGKDRIDALVSMECYAFPGVEGDVCSEVIELRLHGKRAKAPASIVEPLLISDLPVFLRWRGEPTWGSPELDQLVGVIDRLVVDSTEWDDLPYPYLHLTRLFDRAAVSDIAWARTSRWRALLASLWPDVADVGTLRVRGTHAQAYLLLGWLRSRLGRDDIVLEHAEAERLEGIDLDGEPAPFPPGDPPQPSDVLSDELDRFTRDPVYEAAVRAVATP